jgi:hypothetical protein
MTKSGTFTEHEADPLAGADAHRVEFLRAPICSVLEAAPRQVVVPVHQGFRVATFSVARSSHSYSKVIRGSSCREVVAAPTNGTSWYFCSGRGAVVGDEAV